MTPTELLKTYKELLAQGKIDSMEPLLQLFQLGGRPLSLLGREPMVPCFKLARPKRMTLMAGRQVSKSYTLGELASLMTGFNKDFHTVLVEPRFSQKVNINRQIITPLLRDCAVQDLIIDKKQIPLIDAKQFKAGGDLSIANGLLSADGVRGLTAHLLLLDETMSYDTQVIVLDTESIDLKKYKIKRICDISKNDVLTSFQNGCILYSVAVRDASFHGIRPCYKVTTKSGRSITCTEGHLLPTSLGKLRLGEVVEYVDRIRENQRSGFNNSKGGGFLRNTAECYNGVSFGGRRPSTERCSNKSTTMEPRMETTRVQFVQIPAVIRARYKTTVQARESRIRGLLVGLNSEVLQNVSLVVSPTVYRRSKDCNPRISESNNSSNSSSLVVYGRRKQKRSIELWNYSYQQLLRSRASVINILAESEVGYRGYSKNSKTLEYRKNCKYHRNTCKRVFTTLRASVRFLSSFNAIQTKNFNNTLCVLRKRDTSNEAYVLQPSMCLGIQENNETRVLREDKREALDIQQSLEEGAQRGDKQEIKRGLRSSSSMEERRNKCLFYGMGEEEQSSCQRNEEGKKTCAKGKSRVRGKAKRREEETLREGNVRPRETCSLAGGEEELQSKSRCGSEESRSTNSIQSSYKSRSDKACPTVRARSYSREEKSCFMVSSETSRGKGEKSAEKNSIQGAYETRSRVGSCSKREESKKSSSETCFDDPRRKGETFSPQKRTTEIEEGAGRVSEEFFYDPIVSIEYVGELPAYDIEVIGTHNYILANGVCSYNCQDLLPSAVPVMEATTDAHTDTGFRIYSGTAKTSDGTLAMKFEESSQGHWCIKCSHCGKYNIASPDMELFKMMGPEGCSCAYCGKLLDVASGWFLHKYPSRINVHVGYHFPQLIFGFHNTPNAWTELLYKKEHTAKTLFLNETLGVPDDDSVRLLTKDDLLNARNSVATYQDALRVRDQFDLCFVGVDWGGGGGGDSTTGVAVLCKNSNAEHFECIYMTRLQQGLKAEQECNIVAKIAGDFGADRIAHDFTGAGWVREALFINKYPEWAPYMYPISYSYRPTSDLVQYSESGSRASYVVDKTRSLLLTINCLKHHALFIPWFDAKDTAAVQLDFLSIIEHGQDLTSGETEKNVSQRASTVYLLDKVAGKPDDCAQALNIAFVAMCNFIKHYPVLTFDSRYDMTEEQYQMLFGDTK